MALKYQTSIHDAMLIESIARACAGPSQPHGYGASGASALVGSGPIRLCLARNLKNWYSISRTLMCEFTARSLALNIALRLNVFRVH